MQLRTDIPLWVIYDEANDEMMHIPLTPAHKDEARCGFKGGEPSLYLDDDYPTDAPYVDDFCADCVKEYEWVREMQARISRW